MQFEITEIKRVHKNGQPLIRAEIKFWLSSTSLSCTYTLPSVHNDPGFKELDVQIRKEFANELRSLAELIESESP